MAESPLEHDIGTCTHYE